MKSLAKWLLIIFVVLTAFMVILLGLGYLLKENEKSTTALKAQLEQELHAENLKQERREQKALLQYTSVAKVSQQSASHSSSEKANQQVIKQFQQTVINNLTCVTTQQCQVVNVKFNNISCPVAINSIGASQLKKLPTATIDMPACSSVGEQQVNLSCQQNICRLEE